MMEDASPLDAIIAAFPRLFRGRPPEVESSLPPGWGQLVHAMFVDIDAVLNDADADRFRVLQVKEKFGGLRVYWRLGGAATVTGDIYTGSPLGVRRFSVHPAPASSIFWLISARVDQAEQESFAICQQCANEGASTAGSRSWIVTLCAKCRAAYSAISDE